jgi:hypothetical protein
MGTEPKPWPTGKKRRCKRPEEFVDSRGGRGLGLGLLDGAQHATGSARSLSRATAGKSRSQCQARSLAAARLNIMVRNSWGLIHLLTATGISQCAGTRPHDFALSIASPFTCEAMMRLFSGIVAIAAVPAWMGIHVDPWRGTDLQGEMVHHSEGTRRAGSRGARPN